MSELKQKVINALENLEYYDVVNENCESFEAELIADAIIDALEKACLDLINRQKAEIERLRKENKQFADIGKLYSEIKLEIIKEIIAELYNSFRQYENYDRFHTFEILDRIESVGELLIDNLVKEMVGE